MRYVTRISAGSTILLILSALTCSAQWVGPAANGVKQICQRNIYGQVSCYVIANELYNYGRGVVIQNGPRAGRAIGSMGGPFRYETTPMMIAPNGRYRRR